LEKSTGAGDEAAGCCCADTGPDNAIVVATTAILTLSISTPRGDFQLS